MADRWTEEVVLKRTDDRAVGTSVYIVQGEAAILRLQGLLVQFSERCGNASSTLLDLPYFLQKPGLLKRSPRLFLAANRSGVPVGSCCRKI